MQFDEKWSFVTKKQKHCQDGAADARCGDCWDHVALDPEHRLVPGVVVGKRTEENARQLVHEFCERTDGRPINLMTSDEYPAYAAVIAAVYAEDVSPPGEAAAERLPDWLVYATVHKTRENNRVVKGEARLVYGTLLSLAYARNAETLRGVQPEAVLPGDIDANLGAPWIPESDIQAFAADLFRVAPSSIQVGHLEKDAVWSLDADYAAQQSVAATSEYGTPRANGPGLLELALNMKTPMIYDTVTRGDREERVLNREATLAAREKQKLIKERFRLGADCGDTRDTDDLLRHGCPPDALGLLGLRGDHPEADRPRHPPGADRRHRRRRQRRQEAGPLRQGPQRPGPGAAGQRASPWASIVVCALAWFCIRNLPPTCISKARSAASPCSPANTTAREPS